LIKAEGDDVEDIKRQIDSAIEQNYALQLYTHDVSDSPGAVGCHTDRFEEILDYIAAKRDAGLIEPVTIDGFYRAMQGIRTLPATSQGVLRGEVTPATIGRIVEYVGYVWGVSRRNNPEGAAPGASGYDHSWTSAPGDYGLSNILYVPTLTTGQTYYYRAAARIDGVWHYGEELTHQA